MLGLGLAAAPPGETTHAITVGGGVLTVSIGPVAPPVPIESVLAWVREAARAVSAYYERFPVARPRLSVVTGGRGAIGSGRTWGGDEPSIRVSLGSATTAADLEGDWVLTHEMVHLALPELPERLAWVEEGLATYVEPVARARVCGLPPERVWGDLVRMLPEGLPGPGARGLDGTRDWGRTYWGGALFWLLADVEIRERTGNRRGLEHALRGIVAAGGTIESRWPLERLLAAGDAAAGVAVLAPLYATMGPAPPSVDLDDLWKRLGVAHAGKAFEDQAPLAAVRRAITAAAPATPCGR